MAYSYEGENAASTTYETENKPSAAPDLGTPIGLLLTLTYAEDITGYSMESLNAASQSYEAKNTA